MPRGIGPGELREGAGRGAIGHPQIVVQTLGAERQPAVAGVLELLDADGERNIASARGHGIGRSAQGLGAGGAHVLDAGDGDAIEPQRVGGGQRAVAHVDVVERIADPRRLDLVALDPGIGQRLGEGLDHQPIGTHIPALAKAGAAHADNGDLVLDTLCHQASPNCGRASGAAFQK